MSGGEQPENSGAWGTALVGMAPVLAVQAITAQSGKLELLTPPVIHLASMLGSGAWNRDDASRTIAYDAALAACILRAANTNSSSTLGSADAAVSRLGPAKVLALSIAHCLREPYSTPRPEFGIYEDQLWRHSVAAALAAERMGTYLPQPIPNECLSAALLHDLGYLVLAHTLPLDVQLLLADESKQGWSLSRQAELELAGTDHGSVGGAIAGHWGLPQVLLDAILAHHSPNTIRSAHNAHVAHVVNVADMVAATIGESLGKREQAPVDEAGSMQKLSLSEDSFSKLAQEVYDDLEDALDWYS